MVSPQWDQNRFFDDFGPFLVPLCRKSKLFDNISGHSGTKIHFLGPLCTKLKLFDDISGHSGTKIDFGLFFCPTVHKIETF